MAKVKQQKMFGELSPTIDTGVQGVKPMKFEKPKAKKGSKVALPTTKTKVVKTRKVAKPTTIKM
jgi:hypothetical protein